MYIPIYQRKIYLNMIFACAYIQPSLHLYTYGITIVLTAYGITIVLTRHGKPIAHTYINVVSCIRLLERIVYAVRRR